MDRGGGHLESQHIATDDSLARLRGAGLIHRCGDFVFASRAALIAERLLL